MDYLINIQELFSLRETFYGLLDSSRDLRRKRYLNEKIKILEICIQESFRLNELMYYDRKLPYIHLLYCLKKHGFDYTCEKMIKKNVLIVIVIDCIRKN